MEHTRLSKCVMLLIGGLVGAAGYVGSQKKEWTGYFLDDLKAFGINADYWTTAQLSSGREGMVQDGGTRGGTFYGEIDGCGERSSFCRFFRHNIGATSILYQSTTDFLSGHAYQDGK